MTVDELKSENHKLEKAIAKLVWDFQIQTNVKVKYIEISDVYAGLFIETKLSFE